MSSPTVFQLTGPLPSGTIALEASAGSGKTFTIAALATRFIAEQGLAIRNLLLVTFGNAASQELRNRVYERLIKTAEDLKSALQGSRPIDELSNFLAQEQVQLRYDRLTTAISDFDNAVIATTHDFCSRMLKTLGVAADWDGGERFVSELSDLTAQVCEDIYVRRFLNSNPPPFTLSQAHSIAKSVIEHNAEIFRSDERKESADSERIEFAEEVRTEVKLRKARGRLYTYDDLIERMKNTLQDPITSETACQRLRNTFPVVLVDEFQDTDPEQWHIIDTAFSNHTTLVLIGDPKQSIYGFRNADLKSYLNAVGKATQQTLDKNYRSDPGIVSAIVELFSGVPMGSNQVQVRPVKPVHKTNRLHHPVKSIVPLTIRRLDAKQPLNPDEAAHLVDQDVIAQLNWLLNGGMLIDEDISRPIQLRDIAILSRSRARAEQLRSALTQAGLPTVYPGASSVFNTAAASDWAAILAAWISPNATNYARAAITALVGTPLTELIADSTDTIHQISERLTTIGQIARKNGLAVAWAHLCRTFDIDARLLSHNDGSPLLADLGHLAELLSEAELRERLSLEGLADWLAQQQSNVSSLRESADVTRRLDTDADAVSIFTMHGAKGLEFPVVLLPIPTSWLRSAEQQPFVFTTEVGTRSIFVGGANGRSGPYQHYLRDTQAEELRLLYVAMTRAKSAVIAWWVPVKGIESSPLHRLLCRNSPGEVKDTYSMRSVPTQSHSPNINISTVTPNASLPDIYHKTKSTQQLTLRTLNRPIDHSWRRTSYSSLIAKTHDLYEGMADEINLTEIISPSTGQGVPLPLGTLPGGTAFGSLVHLVLEYLDWSVPDLETAIRHVVTSELPLIAIADLDQDLLIQGLVAALRTPLGQLTNQKALFQLPISNRLAEFEFEIPLKGGPKCTVSDLADLMTDLLPSSDPLARYPEILKNSPAAGETLNGFLTGSIDAVLKVDESYVVVDYKTNRMPTMPDEQLTVNHYSANTMTQAMLVSHYPLQALLYTVALHRFLKLRKSDYQPDIHLGGVGYLFVRGMIGPDTPELGGMPAGVFSWFPPTQLILSVSQLLGAHHD